MMATNSLDSGLDELVTEAPYSPDLRLDELSVAELVTLMNDRDATITSVVRKALPSIAGGPAAIVGAVEAAEDSDVDGARDRIALNVGPRDTVVGIASGGRTPYVLGALHLARDRGALTVGLSCNPQAPILDSVDHGIEIVVGPEVFTGSTRLGAGTATKMVLNMFSTLTMISLGKTYGTLMVDLRATNEKLRRRAMRIVTQATGADDATVRRALHAADWHAKLAIAMIATGLDSTEAKAVLDDADGMLGRVISQANREEPA